MYSVALAALKQSLTYRKVETRFDPHAGDHKGRPYVKHDLFRSLIVGAGFMPALARIMLKLWN
jgi:hypothetical protein